jgi:hypothetical protein
MVIIVIPSPQSIFEARLLLMAATLLIVCRHARSAIEFAHPRRPHMKAALAFFLLVVFAPVVFAQGAPPQGSADRPYVMEYYYKVQWGHQQEFLQLFLKNHFPLLREIEKSGRILALKIETPANHMTEELRWDYRVTITYKNSGVATTSNPDEEALVKKLYPDHAVFEREEQRRFEILLAHWDLPVSDITPAKK